MAVPEIASDPTPSEPTAPAPDEPRDAVSQAIRVHEPSPSTSPSISASTSTQTATQTSTSPSVSGSISQKPDADAWEQKPNRALVIALVILLTITVLTLVSQMRTTAALEEQVSALAVEAAHARAAVASYQTRFQLVRDEVGELVTRIGALNSLVAPPALSAGVSDALSDTSTADPADPADTGLTAE